MELFYFVGGNFSMRNFVEMQTGKHKPMKHGGRGKLLKDSFAVTPFTADYIHYSSKHWNHPNS